MAEEFKPRRYMCTKFDQVQIDLPPTKTIQIVQGQQIVVERSPGTIVFKGGNYTAKNQLEADAIQKTNLFTSGLIKYIPDGMIIPEKPKSSIVGQLGHQNMSDIKEPAKKDKFEVSNRDEAIAVLFRNVKNFNIGTLTGKNFEDVVRMARLDCNLDVVIVKSKVNPIIPAASAPIVEPEPATPEPTAESAPPATEPAIPEAPPTIATVTEFPSRNELVLFLVKEKGADPETLKGKKIPEIIKIAKEVHSIDVAIKAAQ